MEEEGLRQRLLLDGTLLFATSEERLGRADLAPDGSWLVVARFPRGNEVAALGELWRLDVAARRWTQLTANDSEERSFAISPDGRQVAFLRGGDVWRIPADRTTAEPLRSPPPALPALAPDSHDPPDTIRVKHVGPGSGVSNPNRCRPEVPEGQVDVIPFEEYVRRVVPYESPSSWHIETLKAQAVAARSYAWIYVLAPAGANYDVTDTTSHQYMCGPTTDPQYANSNAAVDATAGQHLSYNGAIVKAFFSAENSSPTKQYPGSVTISAVNDPISFGFRRNGHGWGFSQWGGKRWADAGWSYIQILRHYYTSARVEPPAGDPQTLLDAANRPATAFQRGSALWLELNANNTARTCAREWKPDGGGALQYGPWQVDGNGADGWFHLFDLRSLPDLAQGQFRVEYATWCSGQAPQATLPVLYLGVDRTPPALAATLTLGAPAGSGAYEASLALSASDATSGVERVGWSLEPWQQEAETLPGLPVLADGEASGGAALSLQPGAQPAQSLTFPSLAAAPGHYRLWLRLRTDTVATGTLLATLRVYDEAGSPLQRAVRPLRAADFPSEGWAWFFVDVDSTSNYGGSEAPTLKPVIEWHGAQRLDVDRLLLATRPADIVTGTTTVLDPPATLTAYASDGAGNVTFARCAPAAPLPAPLQARQLYLPNLSGGDGAGSGTAPYLCAGMP